ncbi:MAG: hypothetical protein WC852_02685 [Candidatus Nanoarchaeia archaeon]|jgi:hypothetical protein
MSGEITTADDLEDIARQVGSNMTAEKMMIQESVVRDNVYLATSRASELLLKVSNDLVSALNGEFFEADIETYRGRDAKLTVKGKVVKIDAKVCSYIEEGYKDGYLIKVCPSKGKIRINLQNQASEAKFLFYFSAKMLLLPCLAAAGALVGGELGAATGTLAGIILAVDSFSKASPLKNYNNDTLFRNYARFALDVSPEAAKEFLDDYLALPGIVYGAVEEVISRNKLLVGDLDASNKKLSLLEEKLR